MDHPGGSRQNLYERIAEFVAFARKGPTGPRFMQWLRFPEAKA